MGERRGSQTGRWRRWNEREQELFGTVVRWTGVGLLIYSVAFDNLRNPALLPAAVSMIFMKTVASSGGSGNGNRR